MLVENDPKDTLHPKQLFLFLSQRFCFPLARTISCLLSVQHQKGCPEFSTGCFLEEIYLRLSILPNESHNATYEVVKAVQWIWCSIFFQFSLPTQSGTANVAAQSAKTVVISNGIGSSVLLFLSFVHSFHRRMNYRVSFRIVLGTAAFFAFLTTLLPLQTERVRLGCYCCEWLQPGSRWHVWCHSWLSWILNHLGQAYRVGAE